MHTHIHTHIPDDACTRAHPPPPLRIAVHSFRGPSYSSTANKSEWRGTTTFTNHVPSAVMPIRRGPRATGTRYGLGRFRSEIDVPRISQFTITEKNASIFRIHLDIIRQHTVYTRVRAGTPVPSRTSACIRVSRLNVCVCVSGCVCVVRV